MCTPSVPGFGGSQEREVIGTDPSSPSTRVLLAPGSYNQRDRLPDGTSRFYSITGEGNDVTELTPQSISLTDAERGFKGVDVNHVRAALGLQPAPQAVQQQAPVNPGITTTAPPIVAPQSLSAPPIVAPQSLSAPVNGGDAARTVARNVATPGRGGTVLDDAVLGQRTLLGG